MQKKILQIYKTSKLFYVHPHFPEIITATETLGVSPKSVLYFNNSVEIVDC